MRVTRGGSSETFSTAGVGVVASGVTDDSGVDVQPFSSRAPTAPMSALGKTRIAEPPMGVGSRCDAPACSVVPF